MKTAYLTALCLVSFLSAVHAFTPGVTYGAWSRVNAYFAAPIPSLPAPNPVLYAKPCNVAVLDSCLFDANTDNAQCLAGCRRNPFTPCLCPSLAPVEAACIATHGCDRGRVCLSDVGARPGQDVCCPSGNVACKRDCVNPQCQTPFVFDPITCGCKCPLAACTGPQSVLDATACACVCPAVACTGGKVLDAATCQCHCPSPSTDCSGTCRITSKDSQNCGTCGNVCPSPQVCLNGKCGCPYGSTLCNGACVDLKADALHCGQCGQACPAGQSCCGGICKNLPADPNNCGACGNVCSGGKTCQSGACACPSGKTSCGGVCRDLQSDPNHCGQCGKTCSGGKTCQNGACTCPSGLTDCAGVCVNTKTDANNCGSCDWQCDASVGFCQNGKCECKPPNVPCGPNGCYLPSTQVCCSDGSGTCSKNAPTCCPFNANLPQHPKGYCCGADTQCCSTGCCY